MPRYAKHKLSKIGLLVYALTGALTIRGLNSGRLTGQEEDQLDADIAEIERRIKLVEDANDRGEG